MRRVRRRRWVVVGAGLLLAAGVALGLFLRKDGQDCARLYDRAARLECRARLGLDEAGDMGEVRALVEATQDPTERDLLILRLVMDDPRRGRWCAEVKDPKLAAWCLDVKGRTHLVPVEAGGD